MVVLIAFDIWDRIRGIIGDKGININKEGDPESASRLRIGHLLFGEVRVSVFRLDRKNIP